MMNFISEIDTATQKAQYYMEKASEIILNYKIRTKASIIKYPNRYKDPRGKVMWNCVWDIINNLNPTEQKLGWEENRG